MSSNEKEMTMPSGAHPFHNIRMHAEEWDVVVWRRETGWMPPGADTWREYRFHCIGSRYGGKFSLDCLEANRVEPPLDNLSRPQFLETVRSELAKAVGLPVRQFALSRIAWARQDAPAYLPCPYRHGANTGYAPQQLLLMRA